MKYPVEVTALTIEAGLFGVPRRFDVHTGFDIYTYNNCPVYSLLSGVVTNVFQFTGKAVGTEWWNDTWAVVVDNGTYQVLFGELAAPVLRKGQTVATGSLLGYITPVLKKYKGVTPTSMLHMEVWTSGEFIQDHLWPLGEPQHPCILNPAEVFTQLSKIVHP